MKLMRYSWFFSVRSAISLAVGLFVALGLTAFTLPAFAQPAALYCMSFGVSQSMSKENCYTSMANCQAAWKMTYWTYVTQCAEKAPAPPPPGGGGAGRGTPVSYTPLTPLPGVPEGNIDVVTYLGSMYKFIIGFIIILAFGAFTYGGFMYVLSSVTSKKGEGKEWMTGAIYGLLIALASYLILYTINPELLELNIFRNFGTLSVDYIVPQPGAGPDTNSACFGGTFSARSDSSTLALCRDACRAAGGVTCARADQNAGVGGATEFQCITQTAGQGACFTRDAAFQRAVPPGGVTGGGKGVAQCKDGNTACSVSQLQSLGYTAQQANIMSCIAVTESSGNPNNRSRTSSACGTFQVIRGTWESVAGRLPAGCRDFSQCTNAQCNAQATLALVQRNGYSDWTCPNCNPSAQKCIQTYSNR